MELMEAIYQRRAVRSYTDQAVEKSTVMELLQAARLAPSAANQQPWAFAVIRGRQRLDEYSERAKQHMLATLPQSIALHRRSDQLTNAGYNVFHHAGTLIVIYAKPAQYEPNEDCCLAAQNLLLAAHGMGLGSCPIGFVRPWLNLDEIKNEFGIPLNYTAVMPVVIGWPAGKTEPTPRIELEVIFWDGNAEEAQSEADRSRKKDGPVPLLKSEAPLSSVGLGW
jgi:nitroreductase